MSMSSRLTLLRTRTQPPADGRHQQGPPSPTALEDLRDHPFWVELAARVLPHDGEKVAERTRLECHWVPDPQHPGQLMSVWVRSGSSAQDLAR